MGCTETAITTGVLEVSGDAAGADGVAVVLGRAILDALGLHHVAEPLVDLDRGLQCGVVVGLEPFHRLGRGVRVGVLQRGARLVARASAAV
jgi:hypothetical protein